jgi:apolipoprotein N-acyltransferase
MSSPIGEQPAPAPKPTGRGTGSLDGYLDANLDRYTTEALVEAMVAAGHQPEAATAAVRRAGARREAAPTRRIAWRLVIVAYLLVYVIFEIGLLRGPNDYGGGVIAAVVLTFVLGFALAISIWWVRRRSGSFGLGALLSVPLVLLLIVGGACYATTGAPFAGLLPAVSR